MARHLDSPSSGDHSGAPSRGLQLAVQCYLLQWGAKRAKGFGRGDVATSKAVIGGKIQSSELRKTLPGLFLKTAKAFFCRDQTLNYKLCNFVLFTTSFDWGPSEPNRVGSGDR